MRGKQTDELSGTIDELKRHTIERGALPPLPPFPYPHGQRSPDLEDQAESILTEGLRDNPASLVVEGVD